jgi:hypothetical protein
MKQRSPGTIEVKNKGMPMTIKKRAKQPVQEMSCWRNGLVALSSGILDKF